MLNLKIKIPTLPALNQKKAMNSQEFRSPETASLAPENRKLRPSPNANTTKLFASETEEPTPSDTNAHTEEVSVLTYGPTKVACRNVFEFSTKMFQILKFC